MNETIDDQSAYMVLLTGDESGDIRLHSQIFMESLRPYIFNQSTHEVIFTTSRIILNIHDAVSNVSENDVNWERLFASSQYTLRSAFLY